MEAGVIWMPRLPPRSLALVQTVQGVVKAGFKDAAHPVGMSPHCRPWPPLNWPNVASPSGCCIVVPAHGSIVTALYVSFEEVLPLYSALDEHSAAHDVDARRNTDLGTARCTARHLYAAAVPLACLYLVRHQLMVARRPYANQSTLDNLDALVILFAGLYTYLLAGKTTPLKHWTSSFSRHIAALFLIQNLTKAPHYSAATYSLLFLTSALSSLVLVGTSVVYQMLQDVSFQKVNLALFSSCLAGYTVMMLVEPSHPAIPIGRHYRDIMATGMVILLHIAGDFLSLSILRRTSAFTVASITLLSSSITTPFWHLFFWKTPPFTNVQWLASALAIYAALSYFLDGLTASAAATKTASQAWPRRYSFVLPCLTLVPFLVLACSPLTPIPHSGSYAWNATTAHSPRLMPHQYDASYNLTRNANGSTALDSACVRRPLPISSEYVGPGARPDFHAFDDVLLVVFFSHARYDINLDGYREVYSVYFPNVRIASNSVCWVPTARIADSCTRTMSGGLVHAEEDISAGWFKMGGRMTKLIKFTPQAHHMLYTAMKDHPCYAGYLWAPFDALLNPQALHAPPPAWVSKQTAEEYYLEANAWGTDWEWWWYWVFVYHLSWLTAFQVGEKHVGLGVCLPAYERMPLHMRKRLEGFTGGAGHLVGGSADTMYLPGHLRADFLDVLGTFLQTDCFLEIALPTTVHLVLPVDEEIAFVDHWWNQPSPSPTNTSFVRQKWEEGYEVDSLHSFHWGDIQDDGFFGPNKNSVADMRALFADSFKRQGIIPPR
ncbi:hypothetical protein B0H13DRAFT_2660188 [Mycena leptocephala]|nr:hypothetical protein B0H13DRAFT_2660188 [Mycena leptocephala]